MTSICDQSPLLPELIHHIAANSPVAWAQIAQAVPDFGRYSMTDAGRREFTRRFLRLHHHLAGTDFLIALICDGSIGSVYDWPAMIKLRNSAPLCGISVDDIIAGPVNSPYAWCVDTWYWTLPVTSVSKDRSTSVVKDQSPRSTGEVPYSKYIHRVGQPAIVHRDGTQIWYYRGKRHRDDGPALICNNGEEWYQHGKLHRDDGPAIERATYNEWWINGKCHRVGGPAVVHHITDIEEWWIDGKRHRDNGPAVTGRDGHEQWWTDDVLVKIVSP